MAHGVRAVRFGRRSLCNRLEAIGRLYPHDDAQYRRARRDLFGLLGRPAVPGTALDRPPIGRSEEHTSELQSLMRNSYAVFCLKKKKRHTIRNDIPVIDLTVCVVNYYDAMYMIVIIKEEHKNHH